MCDTHETIYSGQEFFRISHAGERAGLYRVAVWNAVCREG